MIKEQVLEIARSLLTKSKRKEVRWVSTLANAEVVDFDYSVFLPSSSINFYRVSGDPAILSILNDEGNVVASISAHESVAAQQVLVDLEESIRNSILKVDDTLSDIKAALSSTGVIGNAKPEI